MHARWERYSSRQSRVSTKWHKFVNELLALYSRFMFACINRESCITNHSRESSRQSITNESVVSESVSQPVSCCTTMHPCATRSHLASALSPRARAARCGAYACSQHINTSCSSRPVKQGGPEMTRQQNPQFFFRKTQPLKGGI